MQTNTEIGVNHSGMGAATKVAAQMLENTELTKPKRGDERGMAKVRMKYAEQAEPVGSMPEPQKAGIEAVLADKLGERLAFERTGVRLYDALLAKVGAFGDGVAHREAVEEIRRDERRHMALLVEVVESLGGDPTAQTPAADVVGVLSTGI